MSKAFKLQTCVIIGANLRQLWPVCYCILAGDKYYYLYLQGINVVHVLLQYLFIHFYEFSFCLQLPYTLCMGMCDTGVWMYGEVWSRLTCIRDNLWSQKQYLWERVMQFIYSCSSVFALQSVWVKTGALQWWRNWKPHKWMDVRVALEQFTGSDGMRDSILFIYYMYHEEKKVCSAADPLQSCSWRREASEGERVSLKEANYGTLLFWGLGTNSEVTPGTSKLQAVLSCVNMLCQKCPVRNHSHCLNQQFCTN